MNDQVKDIVLKRIEEFEKLTNEQLLLAGLSRLITATTPKDASFEMALGDLSLTIAMLTRAGGNKQEAIDHMFREEPTPKPQETKT